MLTLNYLLMKHHYFGDIDKSASKLNIDLKRIQEWAYQWKMFS